MMDILWITATCFSSVVLAQNTTTSANDNMTDLSKAFISAGILSGAIIISVIIAKIVDHCYDRASIRDDASDISEHTRNLIRARLAVRNFKMPKKVVEVNKTDKKSKQKKLLRLWSAKARARSGSYPRTPKLDEINKGMSKDAIVKIEEVDELEKSELQGKEKTLPRVTFVTENEIPQGTNTSKNVTVDNSVKPETTKDESVVEKPNENISKTPEDGELPGTPLSTKRDNNSSKTETPNKTSPKVTSPSRPKTAPSGGFAKGNNSNKPPVSRSFLTQKSTSVPGTAKRINTASPGSQPGEQTRGKTSSSSSKPATNTIFPANVNIGKSSSSSGRSASVSPTSSKSGNVTARPALANVTKAGPNISKSGKTSGSTGSQSKARPTVATGGPIKNNQVGRESPTKSIFNDKLQASTQSPRVAASNPAARNLSSILMSVTTEPDKDEVHSKKYVQFRGDSDDLLELVKNEGKTKVEKMSYENEQGTNSSSPEYEFLAKTTKQSDKTKS